MRSKPKDEVQMEEITEKKYIHEKRLGYHLSTFSDKYDTESGRISSGKNIFSILDQLYKL